MTDVTRTSSDSSKADKAQRQAARRARLAKRLTAYSAVAGAVTAAAPTAEAVIIITDPIPDPHVEDVTFTFGNGVYYDVDMDGDMHPEFRFDQSFNTFYSQAYSYLGIRPLAAGAKWIPAPANSYV